MAHLLETHGLKAFYGDAQALFGIDFGLDAGEVIAIIGANGAGKSTFLKSLTGLVKAPRDAILFNGEAIGGRPPPRIRPTGAPPPPPGQRPLPPPAVADNPPTR